MTWRQLLATFSCPEDNSIHRFEKLIESEDWEENFIEEITQIRKCTV